MESEKMVVSPSEATPVGFTSNKLNKEVIRKNGVSATAILTNFVCGMIGPGCFSVAISFKQSGLWAGLFLVFLMGILSLISMYKIVQCSQHLCRFVEGQSLDYGDMAAEVCRQSYQWVRAYDKHAKWIVNGCLIAFQLGVLSVCFVFVADHILEVMEFFMENTYGISKTHIMLIYFIPQLCLNFIKNIRIITFLSLCGNFIIFIAVGLVSKELILHNKYGHRSLPAVTDFGGITMAAGGLIYAFEGQAMVLALENRLKHPTDMIGVNGVLCTSMNLVTLLYAFLGFYGYLAFGPSVADSLTLNLPNSNLTVMVKILLVAKIFLGSALQLYVIVSILMPLSTSVSLKISSKRKEYFLRAVLMIFSLCIALCVPNLYDIIPLVGITSGMLLSLILPAILHTLTFLPIVEKRKTSNIRRGCIVSINLLLFTLGCVFLITGLYSTIHSIILKHSVDKNF